MYCVFFGAMNRLPQYWFAILLILGACSEPEVLEPRDGAVPVGTDFSGDWIMRKISLEERRRIRDAINKTDGVDEEDVFRPNRTTQNASRSRRTRKGGLVYVFLETGTALKITQTEHGLFISFDRSVVEEFRFGENRLVSVGEVEAQRVTGWDGDQLVVETLDKNGMKLTERFQLKDRGKTLQRQITLRSQKLEEETIVQEFDRVD